MSTLFRREFLASGALGLAGLALPEWLRGALSGKAREALKITDIQAHEVCPPFHDYNAPWLFRYHGLGIQLRTIYVVKTQSGLEGIGESWGRLPENDPFSRYVGSSAFDWIGDTQNLAINMALYDLMGKYLGLPCWKLIGPRVRSWVPVAAWTASQPPEGMAEETLNVAGRGFHWLKYHVDVIQNVVDQTEAIQKVAPPGFKVHYDFNADSNVEAVEPVLKELEKFSVAGRIEDPLRAVDHEGYRILRESCSIPVLIHHGPADYFMRHGLCDGFMAGHAPVGLAAKLAGMAESANTPFMLQQCGGTINQAFLAHEAAVFKMAILDHVSLCHLWKEDVTVETMPVVNGSVQVLGKPGLGVTLDPDKLRRLSQAPRPRQGRFLVRMRYRSGFRVYFRFDPDAPGSNLRFLNPPDIPGPRLQRGTSGYANPVVTDFWDEEGSQDFERLWRETESGPVWKSERESTG